MKKLPRLFSTPIASAPTETSIRKGNIMRVSVTATARSSGAKPGAMTFTRNGESIIPAATTALHPKISIVSASSARRFALSRPSEASVREKTGTKEAESAPSAKSWRERFASVYATKNASSWRVAPKSAAVSISRTRPRTRLTSVPAIMRIAWNTMPESASGRFGFSARFLASSALWGGA